MELPELAEAPEIDPVMVPNVQLYELAIPEVSVIPVPVPLHMVSVLEFVMAGAG